MVSVYSSSTAEFSVNATSSGAQVATQTVGLPGGNFLIGYYTAGYHDGTSYVPPQAYYQRFDATGSPVGDEVAIEEAGGSSEVRFAALDIEYGGGWVVSWLVGDGGTQHYSGLIFNAEGEQTGSFTSPSDGSEHYSGLEVVAPVHQSDGFVVVTQRYTIDEEGAQSHALYVERYGRDGELEGVHTIATSDQRGSFSVSLASLGGDFVLVRQRDAGGEAGLDVEVQLFDWDGLPEGDPFLVHSSSLGDQLPIAVQPVHGAIYAPGYVLGYVVTWVESNGEIMARFFDGFELRHEISLGFADPEKLSFGSLFNGDTIVAESGDGFIKLTVINSAGRIIGDPVIVPMEEGHDISDVSVAGLRGGGFVLSWTEASSSDPGEVRALTFQADFTSYMPVHELMPGTQYGIGAGGRLDGTSGPDAVQNADEGSYLFLFEGDDRATLRGSAYVDGGPGRDTVTAGTTAGITLTADQLVSVEVIFGSSYDDFISGGDSGVEITGNYGVDVLVGGAGNDILNGGGSGSAFRDNNGDIDEMYGGAGDDIYHVNHALDRAVELDGEGIDTIRAWTTYTLPDNVENLILLLPNTEFGTNAINGYGNELDNIITGNSANNVLNGLGGADTMRGGAGNDTYYVSNIGDIVSEAAGEGVDTVYSTISYTLTADVENLSLTGSAEIDAYGNSLDNMIIGNSADNILDGGNGADIMLGGAGNDRYYVDDAADSIREAGGDGADTVYSTISYSLAANVENLILLGSAAIHGSGNSLDNLIIGNSVDNVLDGGAGADTMYGGDDNDAYYVNVAADRVVEYAGEGTDHVYSSVTYALSANVENLTLTGTGALHGYGNSLANVIIGNSGDNVLNGVGGADTMYGRGGNDSYYIDTSSDGVVEYAGEGIDTVYSTVSHALTANFENLSLTGFAPLHGYGTNLANIITGNAGDNVLNGMGGADIMRGGAGNDTYYIDNVGDSVSEAAGQGIDTVFSTVSHALTANFENLSLTGSAALNGYGNSLDNRLIGNSGNNTLNGAAGDDTIFAGAGDDMVYGGSGNDRLNGGAGGDRFIFDTTLNASSNVDRITDFSAEDDTIALNQSIFSALPTGTLADSAFRNGTSAQDADDRIIYDSVNGRIYYDADGNGSGAQILFAQVHAGTALTNSDFQVYSGAASMTAQDAKLASAQIPVPELSLPSEIFNYGSWNMQDQPYRIDAVEIL